MVGMILLFIQYTHLTGPFSRQEQDVETPYGKLHCTMKGVPKRNRPVILTLHDIGLNRTSLPTQFNLET